MLLHKNEEDLGKLTSSAEEYLNFSRRVDLFRLSLGVALSNIKHYSTKQIQNEIKIIEREEGWERSVEWPNDMLISFPC